MSASKSSFPVESMCINAALGRAPYYVLTLSETLVSLDTSLNLNSERYACDYA